MGLELDNKMFRYPTYANKLNNNVNGLIAQEPCGVRLGAFEVTPPTHPLFAGSVQVSHSHLGPWIRNCRCIGELVEVIDLFVALAAGWDR